MKKKIIAKPITEIDLEFEDRVIELVFNTESFMIFCEESEEINDIGDVMKLSNLPDTCACIIYSGAVIRDPNFTLEEARKIVSNISVETITEIINEFSASNNPGKLQGDLQKNLMREFLSKKK
jgi:hypothetical protein